MTSIKNTLYGVREFIAWSIENHECGQIKDSKSVKTCKVRKITKDKLSFVIGCDIGSTDICNRKIAQDEFINTLESCLPSSQRVEYMAYVKFTQVKIICHVMKFHIDKLAPLDRAVFEYTISEHSDRTKVKTPKSVRESWINAMKADRNLPLTCFGDDYGARIDTMFKTIMRDLSRVPVSRVMQIMDVSEAQVIDF